MVPGALAGVNSGLEDVGCAGERAVRSGGGFRQRDGWKPLIHVGRF